jgi:RNA polymerase sigma-70 factor (ECF subfamily)
MSAVGKTAKGEDPGRVHVRRASATAFETFFEQERVRLFGALFAITGSRHEAEDISQEAFLRLWERWDRIVTIDDPAGYLYRTAMNVFRDRRRRIVLGMRRAVRLSPSPDGFEAVEDRAVAAAVLGSLTPRQRAAIVLTEGLGYTAEEAGALLGIRDSTVRALHHQARTALRDLEERDRWLT